MNNKIIAPILTENKVNSIAEKYCKKYNLNGSLAYKITAIKFLPDGMKSYGLDIPLWMVVRDVKGWDDMEITILFLTKTVKFFVAVIFGIQYIVLIKQICNKHVRSISLAIFQNS